PSGGTTGTMPLASSVCRKAVSTRSTLPVNRWSTPFRMPSGCAVTALVAAARRSAPASPSRISCVSRLAAWSASSSVAASVTPEPSRSLGSIPRSVASARIWIEAPCTSTVRTLSDQSTATSIRMLPKFSCATAAPSTATTNAFSRNCGTYWRMPLRSVGRTPRTLAGRAGSDKRGQRGDIVGFPHVPLRPPKAPMTSPARIYATCDIGPALDRLREKGFEVAVHPDPQPPPKTLVVEKVRSGIQALITTLRDRIDEEVFAAGAAAGLKVVAQIAVGVDNIDRAAANRHKIPYTHTPDVLTDATAEYAFFMMGVAARRLYPAEEAVRERQWTTWHPYLPWLGDEVTGRTLAVIGTGRIGKSMVAKAVGFDMDVLCHSSRGASALADYVGSVQRVMDLRHAEGMSTRRQKVEAVSLEDA